MKPNVPDTVIGYIKALPEDDRITIRLVFNKDEEESLWVIDDRGMTEPTWSVFIRGIGRNNKSAACSGSHERIRLAVNLAIADGVKRLEREVAVRSREKKSKKQDAMAEYYAKGLRSLNALQTVVDAEWPEEAK